jgi:hypothetical protein
VFFNKTINKEDKNKVFQKNLNDDGTLIIGVIDKFDDEKIEKYLIKY